MVNHPNRAKRFKVFAVPEEDNEDPGTFLLRVRGRGVNNTHIQQSLISALFEDVLNAADRYAEPLLIEHT